MRSTLAVLALSCLLAVPAHAQRAGTYAVEGSDAAGTAYVGTVQLQPTGPDTWRLTWRVAGETTNGVGILQGGIFVVGYQSGRETGVAMYVPEPNGNLVGLWTQGTQGSVGSERLLPR
ncbi:hypothetical protein ACLF3G_04160 [Falsiroseomonas sp. HC035]|uniref:hypothetical protein n=1 Tax=Falsiroseomonas sp. HC035 TaxID=3390999 RepID=UPI003D321398